MVGFAASCFQKSHLLLRKKLNCILKWKAPFFLEWKWPNMLLRETLPNWTHCRKNNRITRWHSLTNIFFAIINWLSLHSLLNNFFIQIFHCDITIHYGHYIFGANIYLTPMNQEFLHPVLRTMTIFHDWSTWKIVLFGK